MIKYNKEWKYRGNQDSYMVYVPALDKYFAYYACGTFYSFLKRVKELLAYLNIKDAEIMEIDYDKVIYFCDLSEDRYSFWQEPANMKSYKDRIYLDSQDMTK